MKSITSLIASILVITLCSCSSYTPVQRFSAQRPTHFEPTVEADLVMPEIQADEPLTGEVPQSITKAASNRLMVYTAELYLLVDNLTDASDALITKAKRQSGYLHSFNQTTVILKIPAQHFEHFLDDIELLGKVTGRSIQAHDVSEKMTDLTIRCDNAEVLRKRYARLLDKGGKIEDLIKIEQKISALTEEIELIQGRIRLLKNQIAFSTITVHLNSALPQKEVSSQIPIDWIRFVGSDIANTKTFNINSDSSGTVVDFDLPEHFMMSSSRVKVNALSHNGIHLSITRRRNLEGGDLEFWSQMIMKGMEKINAITVTSTADHTLETDWPFKLIKAKKTVRGKQYSYYLAVVVFEQKVYLYDAWGPKQAFAESEQDIIDSMKSMQIGTVLDRLLSVIL